MSRSPSDITGLIVAVVIDAIKGKARRTNSDMLKKRFKAMIPFFAKRNAAPAIIFKLAKLRIKAAFFYITPDYVFFSAASSVRFASRTGSFALQATAALSLTASQLISRYRRHVAAIALANPLRVSGIGILSACHNKQSAKALFAEVD